MKIDFDQMVADFQEISLPSLINRDIHPPQAPGTALALIGMRRSGKTWFCYQLMQELMDKGISREQILYINFEDERLLGFDVSDFQTLLDAFYRRNPAALERPCYFFFDEIQEVDEWPRFIRRLLDSGSAEVTITGSSAKMLSSEIHTSLRGRALPCEIFPFSFPEYAIASETPLPSGTLTTKQRLQVERLCEDYLYEGGFPGTLQLPPQTRNQMLQQYLDVVILRDVIERHGVTSVPSLRALVRHIIQAPCTRVAVNKIYNDFKSRGLSCSKNSLHAFMDHLSDAYLFYPVSKYTRSERVRQVNPKKIYIADNGLISAASAHITEDRGALLENLIFMHLRRTGNTIEYFHNDKGHEVDFVVRDPLNGQIKQLIQACWSLTSDQTEARETRGLQAGMKSLNCTSGTIVTWKNESQKSTETIRVVPAWQFLSSSHTVS